MKRNSILVLLAAIGMIVMISSCGKMPQSDIETANAAIDSARTNGADRYLPEQYMALQDSMKAAMDEIESQKAKTFSDYALATQKLNSVATMANELNAQIAVKKAEMAESIKKELGEIKIMLEENKQLIAQAPTGKEGALALKSMQDEMSIIETEVSEAASMFDAGQEYYLIVDKTKAAREKAAAINTELKEVQAKFAKNSKA